MAKGAGIKLHRTPQAFVGPAASPFGRSGDSALAVAKAKAQRREGKWVFERLIRR